MIILTKRKESMVKIDDAISIDIEEEYYNAPYKEIIAMFPNNVYRVLGEYSSLDRAKEILKEIIKHKDELEHVKFLGMTESAWKKIYFEMPEE